MLKINAMAKKYQNNPKPKISGEKEQVVESITVAKSSLSWQIWALLGATFILFIPSLKNGFVNWDDDPNLLKNPNLKVF